MSDLRKQTGRLLWTRPTEDLTHHFLLMTVRLSGEQEWSVIGTGAGQP